MKLLKTISKTLAILLMLGLCFSLTGCFDNEIEKLFNELNQEEPNLTLSVEIYELGMTFTTTIEMDGTKARMEVMGMEIFYQIVEGGIETYTKILGTWHKEFEAIDEKTLKEEMGMTFFPEDINADSFVLEDGVYVLTEEAKESLAILEITDIQITYDSSGKTYEFVVFSLEESMTIYISNVGKTKVKLPI